MIENGQPLSLSSFIDAYKTNKVFTGEYYGKVLENSDASVQEDFKQVKQDIEDNSMLHQLLDMESTVKQMGLAVQVYPQTNSIDKTIIGYKLVVYDPKNKDKVLGDKGEYKDAKGDYSFGKFVNVSFADSVKLGHSGINNYTDVLDSNKNRIVRLKQNEAQLKVFNDKLHIMQRKFKSKGGEALRYVKSASHFADEEMKSVELKTKSNLQDKDDDTYRSGSQMLDAQLAEKVNISPLLTQMKWAYGIDEKYNKKVMELLSLVSHAKNEADALKYINAREKDLKRGIKKYDGFKQAMLSIQKSGIEYDYGNTSETAYSTYKSATFNRNLIAGDVLLSPVLREQGRKNTHNLSNNEAERKRQIEALGIVPGILASRTGKAKGVTYAGDIVNERNELAYDAAVKAIELSDKELAEKGKANLTVREGQSIVSGEYAKLLDTSHHTMNRTFSKKDMEEVKAEFDELSKKKLGNKKLSKKKLDKLDELSPLFNEDGSMKEKEVATYLFTKFLERSKMSLFKPEAGTSDLSNVNIFKNDKGGYTVSGEGQVKFENGRRGTDTIGNMRSEMVEDDQAFDDLHLTKANGEDAGSLASHHIQVIAGREQLDSRKYGTRMKQDLTSTLMDMRSLDKLNDFFAQLKKDVDSTDEIKKNSAEFFSSILELGEDGKVYITDDVKKVNELFEKKKLPNGKVIESDEQAKRRLSGYLAYLDQLRDLFGGNEGLGRVYSLDKDGNLVRTGNARTFYTNLGGDDNVQYGDYSNLGAVDFRTGHDSMTRALRMAVSQMTEDEKKAYRSGNKDVYDVVEDISSQFDAAKKDKEELERLKQSNKESVANMRKTVTQGISVKDLNKGLDEQKYITVGKGKDYDVDIDAAKMEVRDENNEVINKEETLTAMIDKKREEVAEARKKAKIKAMEAELSKIKDKEEKEKKRAEIEAFKKAKADESDLQVVIDTQGVQFGKNVTYGDKTYGYQGKAIYLDRDNGSLKGYQERGYAGEINNGLVNALQSGDVSGIEKAAETVVEKAINSVNYKEGSDYQRLLKKKMPHSISGHTSAVNMANIMTQEEYDEEKKKQAKLGESGNADYRKLLFSDINSFGVQLSKEVVENYLKAKKPDDSKQDEYSDEDLRKMLLGFGLDKKEDVEKMGRNKIVDLILDTLTIDMKDTSRWSRAYKSGKLQDGLSVVAGRFPFMSGLDLDALTKVFIGKDVQGNQIKVGAGLAKKENADYDGDHENLKFMKLSGGEDGLFHKAAGMREDVLRKLSWIAKREGEQNDAEMQVFDDDYYKGVSYDWIKQSALLAGRRNKGATGIFSNFATQIRNTMKDIGFDETNMGHGTKEETENAATAIIVRSYFEAMEQDMISSKKVIKRIVKETGLKEEEITEDFIREYQKNILESVDGIIQQFYDGTISFDDLNKKLASMEIFKTENGKIVLNNRVTQAGLLSIEELEGGKDFLRKISNGKYREYAMYGKATDEDVAFAQSFAEEGKGGFEAWSKTAKADALRKKLDAAGVNYDNRDKDLYDMLLSGKVHEEDYGTVNQDMFMSSMGLITQYAQAHKEAGIDGDPNSFLRTAKNKTHSPDKKNVENNPYHADGTPFTEAEKAAAEKMDENNANAMFSNAAAISDLSAELAGASGDIGKALAAILKYIINFSKGTIAVGNGIMSDAAGAKFLKESKFFKAPFSTTSVTGTVSPYEGISGDPALVDKIVNNKDEKYLGYGSVEELRRNVGSGDAAVAALRGHVVGERTQFIQSLKEMARDKGWKGSEDDLLKEFEKNLDSLRKETDSSVQQTVSFYDAFQADEKKFLIFLEAIHGANGYNDKNFFLKKQKYDNYEQILQNAYSAQSKSLEVFFSPDKMAELNGKKAKTINEDIFVGAADASNEANFVGRTDISGLIRQAVKNQDGSEGFKNVLALVDQKTKYGKKLSPADILQGIMNAFAANEDINLAKSYRNDDGSYDFEGWMQNSSIKAAKERAEQAGLNIDWEQKFQNLVNADEAQSFIQKTNPKTGETSFVSIDSLFPTLQAKVIMAQAAKVMKGEIAPQELMKLINSRVTSLADAGINIEGVDNEAIYADATEDEVTQSYLNLSKRKLELEEKKKELQYQIKDDTIERNDTDLKVLRDKLKQVNEDIKQTEKDIKEAVDTGARLDKFKKKVVDKNKIGAAETTEEVDVEEELKKEKKSQNLKYKQFTGSAQEKAAATYEELLDKKNELEKNLEEARIKQKYRYKLDDAEKLTANKKVIFESQQELEKINKRLEEGNWEKAVGAETYQKLNTQYQQQAELNSKDLNNGTLLQAQQNSAERYNNLMKERIDLYEKQREIIYQIEHLSEKATAEEKAALEAQKKEYSNQIILKDKEIEEEAKTGIDISQLKDSISNSQAQSDEEYNKFVKQKQDEAKAKLSSTLERMIQLRKGMEEREVRSSTAGMRGISKQQQIVNQLANEKDQKEYEELADSIKGVDWESSVGGAEALSKVLGDASRSANLADQQVAALNSDLNPTIWTQMANSVKGWFSQLMRGQLVWKVLGQVQRAIKTVIEDATKLDAVLVNLQIVTGDTRENTRSLISTYAALAQTMSSTTSEVASAANDWLRQGYSISESIDLITASLQLSKLGMIDSGKATSYLTSMLKGFKLEASDATTVVDKLTKVDMSAATSAGDIAEALRQFATTAQLSGVDLDESIAMATTIMDVSQKDASSTGNAIKTMLSRYGNVKAGTYSGMNITGDQNETTESLNDIDKVLKKLGISLRSSNLEFRDFDDVLDDIAAKWETLDSVSKNAIATAMAGTRQRESFLVLMENYDKYRDFIEEAANAEGTAAEKYKDYEDSLEASQKKLAAAWEELASKTEIVDFFKQVNNVMAKLVKNLPFIARTFIRMFSGKAAANALNILQRSGSLSKFSMKGFKTALKSSFDPTYGLFGGKTGRNGLIDSQIRKGTSPILNEVKKITHLMGKSSASEAASGLAGKSYVANPQDAVVGKDVDAEKQKILSDPSLSIFAKRKALKKLEFGDKEKKLKQDRKEIKKEEEDFIRRGDGAEKLSEQLKKKKAKYKKDRKSLVSQKLAYDKDFAKKAFDDLKNGKLRKKLFMDEYSGRTEEEVFADTSLTDRQKKKAIEAIRFDKYIQSNDEKIKSLKQKEDSLRSEINGDKLLEVDDGGKKAAELEKIEKQRRRLAKGNNKLKRDKFAYKMSFSNFERDSYIAAHSIDPELEDGTKLSDFKQNKNGTYSAKGHRGFISKKKYEELKQQQEASKEEAGKEFDAKKRQERNTKAVAAAAAGISGFMSADTRNTHRNRFTGELETNETTNENAKGLMKANTGIATALGTFFGGEAGGAIAGAMADWTNRNIVGKLIPSVREENLKNDRFGQADKKKKQVEEAKSSITNVVDLASKETLTADDYSSLVKAQDELKDFMTKSENAGLKDEFVAYANKFLAGQSEGNEYAAKSFDELTDLADMTDAQRKKTAYALKVAQTKQENLANNAEYEKELDSLNTDLDSDYLDVSGYNEQAKATTASSTALGAAAGTAIGGAAGGGAFSWATALLGAVVGGMAGYASAKAINEANREATLASWNDKSRDEQIAALEEMKAQGKGDSAKLTAMISKLQNINDTIKKIRDKMDQQRVEEGILEMSVGKNADGSDKTLLDLSQNALKDMGADAIIEKMATHLQDKYGGMADGSSYFYTDENGNKQVTAAARKSILKGLKSNGDIYGAITGQNYRLSDVLGMKDGQTKTEMLNNFANALHVSVDELRGLGTAFGNFTLGDLTASAEELSSKFSDMQTAITNIASGTQSWATTLQSVAKTYPELLGYASDEYTLSLAMFQKMSDYKKLQTDAQMADIMANESYFDTFSDKLKESLSGDEWEQFTQAQINSFNDLQQYIANNDTDFSKKLNEAAQAELKNIKLMSNEERQVLEKIVSIKNAQIDKEISNLTSQKEAMQNINSQREYENKLIEAKIRLENASKEKKRVWREGVGWVYEEDQAAISEAKDNLDSVTNEKSISAVTKQIDQLNADKDYLSSILSDQEEATQRAFLQAYSDANGVTSDNITSLGSSLEETLNGNSEKASEKWDEWMKEYKKKEDTSKATLKDQYDALQKAKEAMNNPNLSDEERAKAQEAYNTALSNYQTTYNDGLSKGYWKASDFAEGGDMYQMFGGQNDATVAGAGGAGYKQAQPDQFLYQKDDNGSWNKFVYNPGKTSVLSTTDWNKFYDKDGKTGADFYNATFGESDSNHKLYVNNESDDMTAASIYTAAKNNTNSSGFAKWLEDNFYGPTLVRIGKSGQWTRFMGGLAYKLDAPKRVSENEVPKAVREKGGSFKEGSTDISKGNKIPLLMNEEGSEAIVTPSGTITALPAHSGIVPADVTSNLWNLGNYAPDLLRALQRQTLLGMGISGTAADNSVDNSVNINTVQMTVDADSGFNVDSFVQQLQQVAALTRNNKH